MSLLSIAIKAVFTIATVTATCKPSYTLLDSTFANGEIPVERYKTTKAGLEIIIVNTEGPIVNGYFLVATETLDDNGLPHVLEHLTFLGSEGYPDNGALDLLGNRCYSGGTNAYTTVDHTAYTCSNAGKEGFKILLPIYLDHILYPTLTSNGFTTEVHHIDGRGMDGGVVYSEMQGAQSFNDICFNKLAKALYPKSGYSAYSGGHLKNLRENTTIEMARDYHKKYYRPENLLIIVIGDVTIKEIVKAISKFENKILSKPQSKAFVKPWQKPVPPFEKAVVKVLYPSASDEASHVYISSRGPNCVTEYRKYVACSILLDYLSSDSVGPINRKFPYKILSGISKNAASNLFIIFVGVPLTNIGSIYPKLQNLLQDISDGIEKIDIQYLKNSIAQKSRSHLADLETSPQETISDLLAHHFLYGKSPDDFYQILNIQDQLTYLSTANETYWIDILNEYLVNAKYVELQGFLSYTELRRSARQKKNRIKKRIQMLGPAGLKKKGDELAEAIRLNSLPIPDSVVNSVPYPSASHFKYHNLGVYRTGDKRFPPGLNLNKWPAYAEAYDYKSNFVYITASMYTHDIDPILRPYLRLFLYSLFASPVKRGKIYISSIDTERITKTMSNYVRLGVSPARSSFSCGSYSQTATVMLQVEKTKYKTGVNMLIDLLQNTRFGVRYIKSVIYQLISATSVALRQTVTIVEDLLQSLLYKSDSNSKSNSVLIQRYFLISLLHKLRDPAEAQQIVDNLNDLRDSLLSLGNLGIHVAADWAELNKLEIDVNTPWNGLKGKRSKRLKAVPDWQVMLNPLNVTIQGEVVGLGSVQSAYLSQASPGIKDYNDPDLPALYVALKYLTQTEGPFFRRIRGPGYAYGFQLFASINDGLIQFGLQRVSNVLRAYNEAFNIINGLTANNAVWDKTLLDCAKHAAIFDVINTQRNIGDLGMLALTSSFENKTIEYAHKLVQKINGVTVRDVKRVAKLYMTDIFSTTKAKMVIVCNSDSADEIAEGMKKFGFKLAVRNSYRDSSLSKFFN